MKLKNWSWEKKLICQLRHKFQGAETIDNNFSQAWQDIFILSMLNGKKNGTYLEIGANLPKSYNNTALLADSYEWTGISIDFDPIFLHSWKNERPNDNIIIADATSIDYDKAISTWFGEGIKTIDYLQLDIDPSLNTLNVLKKIPLEKYRFSIITFETDAYLGDFRAKNESREILAKNGYELIAKDVCVLYPPFSKDPVPFEDWWVDPKTIEKNKILSFQSILKERLLPQDLLFLDFLHE